MPALVGPFFGCFSSSSFSRCSCQYCTREFFCETPGMDQLTHLDSKKSTPGSHRPDIWVQKLHYHEYFDSNSAWIIILFLRTSYYNSLLVEQSMILNRRSDDGKKSRKFDFKTKHFRWDPACYNHQNIFRSEMRRRPDEEEEPEKKPRRKISAWWDLNLGEKFVKKVEIFRAVDEIVGKDMVEN